MRKKKETSIGICHVAHFDSSERGKDLGYPDIEDRECAFGVFFKKPGGRRNIRYVYSCTIPAYFLSPHQTHHTVYHF